MGVAIGESGGGCFTKRIWDRWMGDFESGRAGSGKLAHGAPKTKKEIIINASGEWRIRVI